MRDPVEVQVTAVFRELLGLKEIPNDRSFMDLGGHSLLALQLQDAIREELGREVPLAALFPDGTVAGITDALHRIPAEGRPQRLAELTTGGSPTVVCVHSILGTAMRYQTLAQALSPGTTVKAFQAPGLLAGEEPCDSIALLTDQYAAELQARAEEIVLVGYSMGATIAYEMTRLLEARSVPVRSLVLVDSLLPVPEHLRRLGGEELTPLQMLAASLGGGWDLRTFLGYDRQQGLERLYQESKARALLPATFRVTDLERLLRVIEAHVRALAAYVPDPGPIEADVTVCSIDRTGVPDDLWWREVTGKAVTRISVPGPHRELMDPPNVGIIAAAIQKASTIGAAS